jgi:hypothetical protein
MSCWYLSVFETVLSTRRVDVGASEKPEEEGPPGEAHARIRGTIPIANDRRVRTPTRTNAEREARRTRETARETDRRATDGPTRERRTDARETALGPPASPRAEALHARGHADIALY